MRTQLRNAEPALSVPLIEEIQLPTVFLKKSIGHLEHAKQQCAFGAGPGVVAAAGRAPDEVARSTAALSAFEAAFENPCLLNLDMFMVRQSCSGRHLQQ